ncbi:MAG: molybdopterin-binding/glycosyltransferase family 2 protein [Pseudomonadota bacterium]
MRFGAIPIEDAEGAVLAHSLRVGEIALKKGRALEAADIESLRAAGIETVVAAKLEGGDLQEDLAAQMVADAIVGSHVRVDQPFTGRVNLFAEQSGLLAVDPARVDKLNELDEAVTFATLDQWSEVRPGQMVGTAKIIPFAARANTVRRWQNIAADGPILSVAPYRRLDVALIQTRLPGTKEAVLDKTVRVTAGRITATGGRLISEARCAHSVADLAARIESTIADLILIAGASAITDRRDVLPKAIEVAGGKVEHFGMPVDPGNLLLLGTREDRPVLGLPGCARSPKLNGFDWVLRRLAAGIEITSTDIMRMGVGGLLMEIPTRPQPREGTRSTGTVTVAAIVLAAGQSRRMGPDNKLLALVDGKPMVRHVVDALLASRASSVTVVTGHQAEQIRAAVGDRPVVWCHNPNYADGLSTSLRTGLEAIPDGDGVLIALGDMPRVKTGQIDRLIAAFNPYEDRSLCVPTVAGKRGNPVLFATRFVPEMLEVSGDVGARHLIGVHAEEVVEIEMEDNAALLDIDTPDALSDLLETTQ